MKNQKSRRLNRKQIKRKTIKRKTIKRKTIKRKTIKRNTIKRKQNKKLAYNQKKLYGGNFNTEKQEFLKLLLQNKFNFSDDELEDVMTKLNLISHVYSKPSFFKGLKTKIMLSTNKREFTDWLESECCSDKYHGATDYESSDDSDVYVYDSDDDDDDDDW
jgi:hypothetical protein